MSDGRTLKLLPPKSYQVEDFLERVRMPSTDHELADGIAPPLSIKEKVKKLRISSDHTCLLSFFGQNKFNTRKEHIEDEMKKEANNVKKEVEEDFGTGKFAKYQRILWDLIEKPHTSTPAKVS